MKNDTATPKLLDDSKNLSSNTPNSSKVGFPKIKNLKKVGQESPYKKPGPASKTLAFGKGLMNRNSVD